MKNIIILLFTALSIASFAQQEEMPKMGPQAQEKIKAAHIAFITERLGLTPAEAEKFWPVYREFSMKRNDLRHQFNQRKNHPDPNKPVEQNEKEMVEYGLQLKQQELDLEKEYSGKLMNVISPQKVMQLRTAEEDFRRLVIKQIQQRQSMQQQRDRNEQRFRQRNN